MRKSLLAARKNFFTVIFSLIALLALTFKTIQPKLGGKTSETVEAPLELEDGTIRRGYSLGERMGTGRTEASVAVSPVGLARARSNDVNSSRTVGASKMR